MSERAHWESVYTRKSADEVTWYQPHLERSLAFIRGLKLPHEARVVDIGGGASTLADDLSAEGYQALTVIDLAEAALAQSKARLGARAEGVEWRVGDVTTPLLPPQSVDLWHDRAVFHFLTDEARRAAYIEQVTRCVKPGGYVLISTFALDGPERCSGLPVRRYDVEGIRAALGDGFEGLDEAHELHVAPWGGQQSFVYNLSQRDALT